MKKSGLKFLFAVLMCAILLLLAVPAMAGNTVPRLDWSKTIENLNSDYGTETYTFTLQDEAKMTFTLINTRTDSSNNAKVSITSVVGDTVGTVNGFTLAYALTGRTSTTTKTLQPDTYTVTVQYFHAGYEFSIEGYYVPSVGVTSVLMAKGSTFTVPVSRAEDLTQSWRSSYSGVAAVSSNGEITAAREGTATVYCDFSDGTSCSISVRVVSFSYTEKTLSTGDWWTCSISYLPNDAPPVIWESSDEHVAAVDSTGRVTAMGPGQATVTARLENCVGELSVEITVPEIYFTETECSLTIGSLKSVTVQNVSSGAEVRWSSSKPKVAAVEVSTSGSRYADITAVGSGTAVIRATVNDSCTVSMTVKVAKAKLNYKTLKMKIGQSERLELSGIKSGLYDELTWKSSKPKVVRLGKDTQSNYRWIEAYTPGTSVITVSYQGKKLASVTVKVSAASISPGKLTLKAKATKQLKIKGLYKNANPDIKWTSSNKKIATVNEYGEVTGKKAGTVKISASINGSKKISVNVKVIPSISKSKEDVATGETVQLKINGAGKNPVIWTSGDSSVASVSDSGLVTGNRTGTVTITAKCSGTTMKCTVTVRPRLVLEVVRIREESIYNSVYINFHNYSNKTVVYTKFNILQYDNAGRQLRSPYSYFYLNETINPKSVYTGHYYWVNDDTKSVKLVLQEVIYSDGSVWHP